MEEIFIFIAILGSMLFLFLAHLQKDKRKKYMWYGEAVLFPVLIICGVLLDVAIILYAGIISMMMVLSINGINTKQ